MGAAPDSGDHLSMRRGRNIPTFSATSDRLKYELSEQPRHEDEMKAGCIKQSHFHAAKKGIPGGVDSIVIYPYAISSAVKVSLCTSSLEMIWHAHQLGPSFAETMRASEHRVS
jgi:hypothetical protein